jgi:serine/threonine protein phosphatase PrpC
MAERKPHDAEIDVFGLTHVGNVRTENQDHYMICSLHKQMVVHSTSLPPDELPGQNERLAFLGMVADGVGGGLGGEQASRLALEEVTSFVHTSLNCYYTHDSAHEDLFVDALRKSAQRCHARVLEASHNDAGRQGMATTLTLVIGVWPRAYVVQVGDSRAYLLHRGELIRLTRDQTVAQDLVDAGVIESEKAEKSTWSNVLASAIGGNEMGPVVTSVEQHWGDSLLLCSDGLTLHVSDEELAEHLRGPGTAEVKCQILKNLALERGGKDNVTILIGSLPAQPPE